MKIIQLMITAIGVLLIIIVGLLVIVNVEKQQADCNKQFGVGNWVYAAWNGTDWQPGLWIENEETRCIFNGTKK
jgi:hypothetical protein